LFFIQFWALWRKNWIMIWKHKWLNFFRCLLLPIGFGAFVSAIQYMSANNNNYGIGSPAPVKTLAGQFNSSKTLVWADNINGSGIPSANDIMARITTGFSSSQLSPVTKVASADDFATHCTPNFNGISNCWAGIAFNSLFTANNSVPV
ncbi:hypothetical protein BJ138DRAFT_988347, partial [Hygrophoropsis aurantiaca]